jgi:hypothetical protein
MDASNYGIGVVLSQEEKDNADLALSKGTMPKLHPVAFYSATFMPLNKSMTSIKRSF